MTEMCITVASHHFVVTRINPRVRPAVNEFVRSLIQFGLIKQRGRFVQKADRVYAASTDARDEVRLHINHLEDFKKVLDRHYIHDGMIEWRKKDVPPAERIVIEMQPHLSDLEHQIAAIDYIAREDGSISRLIELQTGRGKRQPLDAKIKIPGGWTTMGEIKVGDTITAWDGTPTKVTGVFPEGEQIVYKVQFADGRWTEAGPDHLWRVYYINTQPHCRWRVVDTLEVLRLISMPNPRVYVQLIESEIGDDVELPIPPYTLGAILGDGGISTGSVTVTKLDEELFSNISDELPEALKIVPRDEKTRAIVKSGKGGNHYINSLRTLGLMGKRSWEKFVPEQYLHASTAQRLALLQGLMDTDGTSSVEGSAYFASSSLQLARDVQYLVRSLGGIASIRSKIPHYEYKGERLQGRECYVVGIRMKKPTSLFRLPRKRDRLKDDNQYSPDLKLRVHSVEMVGIKETQCISVDHPDRLYVTDEFIVTHNTYSAMRGAQEIAYRTVVMLKPGDIEQWLRDFKQNTLIPPERICVIQGSKSLMSLLNIMADEGSIPYDIIIISNATFRNYLSEYEKYGKELLDLGYACLPEDFFGYIKAGFRIIDEVHRDFHLNFKCDLYTNIYRTCGLSATFQSDNQFVNKMYEVYAPRHLRYAGDPYVKYVNAMSLQYSFANPERIKTMGKQGMYSHHEFETSIMKYPNVEENYYRMVHSTMMFTYEKGYRKPNRCLVYFASIEMCTRFRDWIADRYPELTVARYVEEDSYQEFIAADIGVSTVGSAGTGKDIPDLTTVILTVAIRSTQSNLQGFGRIRQLKDGRRMEFIYFVCTDFPKHVEYHDSKVELLRTRALTYEERFYSQMV